MIVSCEEIWAGIKSKKANIFLGLGVITNIVGVLLRHITPMLSRFTNPAGWLIAGASSMAKIYDYSRQIESIRKNVKSLSSLTFKKLPPSVSTRNYGLGFHIGILFLFCVYIALRAFELLPKMSSEELKNDLDMSIGSSALILSLFNHIIYVTCLDQFLQRCQREYSYLRRANGLLQLKKDTPIYSSYRLIGEQLCRIMARKTAAVLSEKILNLHITLHDTHEVESHSAVNRKAIQSVLDIEDESDVNRIYAVFLICQKEREKEKVPPQQVRTSVTENAIIADEDAIIADEGAGVYPAIRPRSEEDVEPTETTPLLSAGRSII